MKGAFKISKGSSTVSGNFSQLEKLVKNLKKKYYVDIGVLGAEGKTAKGGDTLAGIGAKHEFGVPRSGSTPGIPQRSFIRMPLEKKQAKISADVKKRSKSLMEKGDIEGIFKLIGIAGEAAIKEAFETGGWGLWPDIAESTKEKKGSDAILIDEGDLRDSITSRTGS